MLSDTLPAGSECVVLNGQVKAGDTVAIVGPGLIRRLPASAVPVIAAAPEQKDQHDDQQDSAHDLFPPFLERQEARDVPVEAGTGLAPSAAWMKCDQVRAVSMAARKETRQ